MITFLRGKVVFVSEKKLVLDVNDVGFQIGINARDSMNMPPVGEKVTVYTYMSVSENGIGLYGFLSEEDLEIYKMLLNVSGIGPKGGLGVLSAMSAEELRIAVITDDEKKIAKAPGIGPKTAKKLILELKDKISAEEFAEKELRESPSGKNQAFDRAREEAVQVLVALGYSRSEAVGAVRKANLTEDMDSDQILAAALEERQ